MTAIFKRELTAFYKTPAGWFVTAVYAFLSALMFYLFVIGSNTSYLGTYFGMWLVIIDVIIISVLSMRFFSEERKNKTDQLIMTSPVSLYGVVGGKFLGAYTIMLACTSINLIYILITDFFDDSAHELGTLAAGELGVLLLGTVLFLAAAVSVAVFVSSVTENSAGAAAGTFGLFLLMYVADWISGILPAWLAAAVSSLNIFSMFHDFANGILSLKSVVYYISVTVIFLFLTVRVLEKRRWS